MARVKKTKEVFPEEIPKDVKANVEVLQEFLDEVKELAEKHDIFCMFGAIKNTTISRAMFGEADVDDIENVTNLICEMANISITEILKQLCKKLGKDFDEVMKLAGEEASALEIIEIITGEKAEGTITH